jgi:ergothioneine biosynthesis protein EgtB
MTAAAEYARGGGDRAASLERRYEDVRRFTEMLCEPLEMEDFVVQSMPDASPVKWHLAHTTWFFETFVLARYWRGYEPYHPAFGTLFNSYYEAVGPRHPRPERGLLTRPTVAEVFAYREAVDAAIQAFVRKEATEDALGVLELGLHHEQQHQELLLTDVLHAFSRNPLRPVFSRERIASAGRSPRAREFVEHEGGLVLVGHAGEAFAFDNEGPAHRVYLEPFAVSSRLVTAGEYMEFIADGGYRRPELWLSEGFAKVRSLGWKAPLYWEEAVDGRGYDRFTLHGTVPIDEAEPVCHVSYYEADAFARWARARLPTEAEWEVVARDLPSDGQFVEDGRFEPAVESGPGGFMGGAWVWTASPYAPYPGYAPLDGALGEYNGKFMVNQMVLRGGSCCSPRAHLRTTYRNFFPPDARWQFTGIRLARS